MAYMRVNIRNQRCGPTETHLLYVNAFREN